MSPVAELRRRKVFRVGAAYVVVGWLLLQVADVLLGNFSTPNWVFQSFTAFSALGFALALFLAWAFELTPYLIYPQFDAREFPALQELLESEGIERPVPRPIPFACDRAAPTEMNP